MDAIAHFNNVLAGMLQNVGHESPDVCHLRGQGRKEVHYVKIGRGQDRRMNEPRPAECVDEEPLVGEKEQNGTSKHGEGTSVLLSKPAKAAVEKRGQHQDLRLRLHQEGTTERQAGEQVVPDCVATHKPEREENEEGELEVAVTKREDGQEPGMKPVKQGIE